MIQPIAAINTNFTVSVKWFHNSSSIAGNNQSLHITAVAPRQLDSNHYQAQLVLTTLNSIDTGLYTCAVFVDSPDSLLHVDDALSVNSTAYVVVVNGE